jgi:hypothetical protein
VQSRTQSPGWQLVAAPPENKQPMRVTLALVACGAFLVAFLGATTPAAKAIEAPEPNPTTYNVVLTGPVTTAKISVTTDTVTRTPPSQPAGRKWAAKLHCASVWSQVATPAFLGHACSTSATFLVPIKLNARTFPLGRSGISIVDDAAGPPRVFPAQAYVVARRLSSFGKGYFEDKGRGDLYFRVPIRVLDPLTGKLRPQNRAPVALRVLTRHGWRTKAVALSNAKGIAQKTVHLGPGPVTYRMERVATATLTAAIGVKHKGNLNTEPVAP